MGFLFLRDADHLFACTSVPHDTVMDIGSRACMTTRPACHAAIPLQDFPAHPENLLPVRTMYRLAPAACTSVRPSENPHSFERRFLNIKSQIDVLQDGWEAVQAKKSEAEWTAEMKKCDEKQEKIGKIGKRNKFRRKYHDAKREEAESRRL